MWKVVPISTSVVVWVKRAVLNSVFEEGGSRLDQSMFVGNCLFPALIFHSSPSFDSFLLLCQIEAGFPSTTESVIVVVAKLPFERVSQ